MGKKKNKKTKSQLVFSETDRVDFITGKSLMFDKRIKL